MKHAILSIFALGWIDILNPVAISTVLLLIPLVRKRWHTLIYIWGAYFAYLIAGIAIYYGADVYFADFYKNLCETYPTQVGIAKLVIGAAGAIGCAAMISFLLKAHRERRELSFSTMLAIKSVNPWFIALLSFGSTWSCVYASYALFIYIGILISNQIPHTAAFGLLLFFCLFSVVPTYAVYIASNRFDGKRFNKIMDVVRKIMTGFCFYSIPVLLAIVAYWGITSGLSVL